MRRSQVHDAIETFGFDGIPLNRDVFVRPESALDRYVCGLRAALDRTGEVEGDSVVFAAARGIEAGVMHLSWYPNVYDRFHEVRVRLPRSAFVTGIDCWVLDVKPSLFVKDHWLQDLYRRSYSLFAMVDAIGVKRALFSDQLTPERLLDLQQGLDALAATYPEMMFVSFADSLLIKANWFPLKHEEERGKYSPERLIVLLEQIQGLFKSVLALDTYAVVAQGANEYRELVHVSEVGNHLSLNSLGLPFAQIQSIDQAVREALRQNKHAPAQVYLEESVLRSLQLRFGFDKASLVRGSYSAPLASGPASYVLSSRAELLGALES